MKRKILVKKVTVTGPNFWGWESSIDFLPSEWPGWFIRTKDGNVPIDFRIAYSKKGRLQLKKNGVTLNVIEHIIALKLLVGLDNIILVPHNKWPPYLGGAGGYAKQLEGAWRQTDDNFQTIEPKKESTVRLNNELATEVSIKKSKVKKLSLTVHSHWKPLPSCQQTIVEMELGFREDILYAKPQGFPAHREYLADLSSIFGWPNKKYVSWMSSYKSSMDASYDWWAHAVQDALGALALCHYQKIPVLNQVRSCAGHKQDLEAIRQSFS
ncbi:MAG: UDP-3-O-acyl-N-acetylglucosamine deacetylase [Patescibacteria group bacterium]